MPWPWNFQDKCKKIPQTFSYQEYAKVLIFMRKSGHFWVMTCKIIFHFQAMRVLLFLNHEQRYKIACRWLRTSLLPKNKSFCSVRNPFGKWKLWQLYNEREIMQTYLQISFLNPIRFDPLGTICHINGLMQKSHWYFAPFVEAWKGSNK